MYILYNATTFAESHKILSKINTITATNVFSSQLSVYRQTNGQTEADAVSGATSLLSHSVELTLSLTGA